MSTVSDVRTILGDMPKFDRQTATGDGASKQFAVTGYPIITGTEVVMIDGSTKTRGTDYTLNAEIGLISFTSAPATDAVIAITFQYAEISDESLTSILAFQPDIYFAAAMAARSIAGRYTSMVDKQVGDLSISYSQRAKAWAELAKMIEKFPRPIATDSAWAGGINRDEKLTNYADSTKVAPFFTRTMTENPPAQVSLQGTDLVD